jgi:16S rRNA (cytidine1402-2'-O)-methyltransferase
MNVATEPGSGGGPTTRGVLFLIPSTLGDSEPASVLSELVIGTIRGLHGFIAEDARAARAFLRRVGVDKPLTKIRIQTLDEHTHAGELPGLLAPALHGERIGLLSEAGYPAVADPGTQLIALAHQRGVPVVPLVGPSSLLLALAASGLNGQRFCFDGYLPVEVAARAARIRELEVRSRRDGSAQLFIEAPYRNNQLLAALMETCDPDTRLCLATELTLPGETIRMQQVDAWRCALPDLNRRPTVFVLQARERASINASQAKRSGARGPRRLRPRSGGRSARPGSREA